jgi:hypothetical protein
MIRTSLVTSGAWGVVKAPGFTTLIFLRHWMRILFPDVHLSLLKASIKMKLLAPISPCSVSQVAF